MGRESGTASGAGVGIYSTGNPVKCSTGEGKTGKKETGGEKSKRARSNQSYH